jgi:hypothetical protein
MKLKDKLTKIKMILNVIALAVAIAGSAIHGVAQQVLPLAESHLYAGEGISLGGPFIPGGGHTIYDFSESSVCCDIQASSDAFTGAVQAPVAYLRGQVSARNFNGSVGAEALFTYFVQIRAVTPPPRLMLVPVRVSASGEVNISSPPEEAAGMIRSEVIVSNKSLGCVECSVVTDDPACQLGFQSTRTIFLRSDGADWARVELRVSGSAALNRNTRGLDSIAFQAVADPVIEIDPDFEFRDFLLLYSART